MSSLFRRMTRMRGGGLALSLVSFGVVWLIFTGLHRWIGNGLIRVLVAAALFYAVVIILVSIAGALVPARYLPRLTAWFGDAGEASTRPTDRHGP